MLESITLLSSVAPKSPIPNESSTLEQAQNNVETMGIFGKTSKPHGEEETENTECLLDPESLRSDSPYLPPRVQSIPDVAIIETNKELQRGASISLPEDHSKQNEKYCSPIPLFVDKKDGDDGISESISSHNIDTNNATCCAAFEMDCGEGFEVQFEDGCLDEPSATPQEGRVLTAFVLKRLSRLTHRWRSFKRDQQEQRERRNIDEIEDNDGDTSTLSCGSSNSSQPFDFCDPAHNDGESNSGIYPHFFSWSRHRFLVKRKKRASIESSGNKKNSSEISCNKYAREQVELWKRASIEGPRLLQVTALVLTLIIIASVLVLIIFFDSFWTAGAVITCIHLLIASSLILLFEIRPGFFCHSGLGSSFVGEDYYVDEADILPIDSDHGWASKARRNILERVGLFRWIYGRGCLYLFMGSTAFVLTYGSWHSHFVGTLLVSLPGLALMAVGVVAILAGVHASFRWALLDASMNSSDEYLQEKFLVAAGISSAARRTTRKDSAETMNRTRLDRREFSILVMTLGLDLDEISVIPGVFAEEIHHSNAGVITFDEFVLWWRGICPTDRNRKQKLSFVRKALSRKNHD